MEQAVVKHRGALQATRFGSIAALPASDFYFFAILLS
jgi:hypothetical protein